MLPLHRFGGTRVPSGGPRLLPGPHARPPARPEAAGSDPRRCRSGQTREVPPWAALCAFGRAESIDTRQNIRASLTVPATEINQRQKAQVLLARPANHGGGSGLCLQPPAAPPASEQQRSRSGSGACNARPLLGRDSAVGGTPRTYQDQKNSYLSRSQHLGVE